MSQISAGRCLLSEIPASPLEIITFGSPRVGTKRYVQHANVPHVRWVNNNDIVTRVPPSWLRYKHRGDRMYIGHAGKVHDRFPAKQRVKDQWRGFASSLKNRKIDHFSDHGIAGYTEAIVNAIAERG
ncbi:MAG: triacylglycerol lipase [Candidatus Poriferisodalaceae bacterium]|jgi:triacylglycerol lipase